MYQDIAKWDLTASLHAGSRLGDCRHTLYCMYMLPGIMIVWSGNRVKGKAHYLLRNGRFLDVRSGSGMFSGPPLRLSTP